MCLAGTWLTGGSCAPSLGHCLGMWRLPLHLFAAAKGTDQAVALTSQQGGVLSFGR